MKQKLLLISLITGLLLVACGGDDDDDGTNPSPISPAYTGLETEATISISNAESLVKEMFGLGDVVEEVVEPKPEPYNIRIPLALTETIKWINTENAAASTAAAKIINTTTYCDDSQGRIDYIITIDDITGVFNGEMNYYDCQVGDFTLNGSADVNGNYDLVNNIFLEITLDFTWFRGDAEYVNYEAADQIKIEFIDATTTTTTLTDYVVTIDNLPVVKFADYAISIKQDETAKSLILSGIFYHPEYGFVTLSTDGLLTFTQDNTWPYEGRVVMDGDSSALRIDCWDNIQYTLWVDEDGDGDYIGEIVNW